jgi:serine/threonine protein kinase
MPQAGRLTVIQGTLPNTEYPLPIEGDTTIGRNRRMSIPILMRTVSRKHAKISFRNGTYTISDLGSKSGTLVNERKVTTTILRHGDRIQIGRVKFRFWMQAPERPQQREPAAPQAPLVALLSEPVVIPPKPTPPATENEPAETAASGFTAEELARVGRTLGGTKLIAVAARTRRAIIYKGTQASHNRVVAFKILRPEAAAKPEIVAWFIEGARRASQLRHEDILAPLGGGSEEGATFLYLTFMHNGSAVERFTKAVGEGIPAAKRALEALVHVTRALEFAHSSDTLHLGLRPSKILFDEEQRAKLVGLGFDNRTSAAGAESTPDVEAYLAPEQFDANSNPTVATDVFSLGATFYYMLTGRHPQRDRRHRISPPKGINRVIPDSICRIAEKMLNPDPRERYQSYGLLLHDLRWALRGEAWPHA